MLTVQKEKLDLSKKINPRLHTESTLYVSDDNMYKIIYDKYVNKFKENCILDLERLQHPYCSLPNFAIMDNEKICGYSMHYYKDYMTLESFIRTNNISIDDRKLIINKIGNVLKYFQSIGFIYGDIHLNNILINDKLDVVFIDLDSGIFSFRLTDYSFENAMSYINSTYASLALQLLLEYVPNEDFYYDFTNVRKNSAIRHISSEKNKLLESVFYNTKEQLDVMKCIDMLTSSDVDEIQYRLKII